MIHLENVGMRYGQGPEILSDISFSIPRGSFHFVTGRSGAGKTSLLKLMYLGSQPSRGYMTLFGRDVSTLNRHDRSRLRRRIGVVFQDFRLIPHLSAVNNVALPLRLAGASEDMVREHVKELLRWVGLGRHLDASPSTLSGGEQQRIAIARAVVNRPDLLLADEPTGNVDDEVGWRLLRLFGELNKLGTTVVVATHNEEMIRRMDRPALVLHDGRLFQPPAAEAAWA